MNIAILPLNCRNEPRVTTLTRNEIQQITKHVADYFKDQSGGREQLEYRVFDWFTLPITSTEWNELGFNAGGTVIPMVEQGQQIDLSSYGHFVLLIDKQDANSAAWNSPGPLKYCHMAAQSLDPALLAHELGHMYGADHADLDTPNGREKYGDQLCIMGREGNKFSFIDTALGTATGPFLCECLLISWVRS